MELGNALCTWRGVGTSNGAPPGGRVRSVSMLDYSTKHSGISAQMVVFQQGRVVELDAGIFLHWLFVFEIEMQEFVKLRNACS